MIDLKVERDDRYAFRCGGNHNCYARTHGINWHFLSRNIGGEKEKVGDIDGFLEKNNCFLFLEWKSIDKRDSLPFGQKLAFERLTKRENIHVIYVFGYLDWDGKAQCPVVLGTRDVHNGITKDFHTTDTKSFVKRIQSWYDWTATQKNPH